MLEYNSNLNMIITKNGIKLFVLREDRKFLFLPRENQEDFMKEVHLKLGHKRKCLVFLDIGIG